MIKRFVRILGGVYTADDELLGLTTLYIDLEQQAVIGYRLRN